MSSSEESGQRSELRQLMLCAEVGVRREASCWVLHGTGGSGRASWLLLIDEALERLLNEMEKAVIECFFFKKENERLEILV